MCSYLVEVVHVAQVVDVLLDVQLELVGLSSSGLVHHAVDLGLGEGDLGAACIKEVKMRIM